MGLIPEDAVGTGIATFFFPNEELSSELERLLKQKYCDIHCRIKIAKKRIHI